MTRTRRPTFLGVLLIGIGLVVPAAVQANSPIYSFTQTVTTTQAGGHPDIETTFKLGNRYTQDLQVPNCQCQDPKDVIIHAPAGVIGTPRSLPQCNQSDFAETRCAIDTQVGVAEAFGPYITRPYSPNDIYNEDPATNPKACANTPQIWCPLPVFNLVPHPGQAGLLGFLAPFVKSPIFLVIDARTESDYGLEITTPDILHTVPLGSVGTTLWGVPADPYHDRLRMGPPGCVPGNAPSQCDGNQHSNAPLVPFISNPTTCGEPLTAGIDVFAYDHGLDTATIAYPTTTGCDRLSFNPSLFGQPTTTATDTASGFDIDLKAPQLQSASTPSPSEIRNATVTLPEGFSINPNAADGKEACTDQQAKIGTRLQAECPENAKVGTVTVSSDALPGPLPGFIYLGEPKPGDPYRLLLVFDGFGLHVKLAGSVDADAATGRLLTSFQDLPQFPFSDFNMHFFGSERGLLATPERCGTYSVDSTFTPWDAALPDQSSHQFFSITSGPDGEPCPGATRPFDPSFQAGVTDKTAAKHTNFVLQLTREDGDQNLADLEVDTPPGFSATLKGIPYCPEASIDELNSPLYTGISELASSACPPASQIGTATAGAGAGSHPVYVDGKVFLAGPYKGAPLSLVVSIPAVSGPYDLGAVTVRAALHVDPVSAQVSAISDSLPQILGGVPLRTRSIQVRLNRPDFVLNPTNCTPFSVGATVVGDEGTTALRNTPFHVANCADLPFEPGLELRVGNTKRRSHPALTATLRANDGDANLSAASVALPRTLLLDNAHIKTICTRVQFAASNCPAASVYGNATAVTPILDEPLRGPVYLRSSDNDLPDMVIDLHGQVDFAAAARIDQFKGGTRTTFDSIPDIPLSRVTVRLRGGKQGLLQVSTDLCRADARATFRTRAQNGRRFNTKTELQTGCAGKARKRPRKHLRRETGQ